MLFAQLLSGKSSKQRTKFRKQFLLQFGFIPKICRWCKSEYKAKQSKVGFCSPECLLNNQRKKLRTFFQVPENRLRKNAHIKLRRTRDPEFRIKDVVRNTVNKYLHVGCEPKRSKVVAALPFLIPQLKAHLESQFNNTNGFTWENYGTAWELDHIVPQALFRFTTLDEKAFRDCWALNNLRPLACMENLLKGKRSMVNSTAT